MPKYEIKWNAFGFFEVDAEDEDEAVETLHWELSGTNWDGLDWEIEEIES